MLKTKQDFIAVCQRLFSTLPGYTAANSYNDTQPSRIVLIVHHARLIDTLSSDPIVRITSSQYGNSLFKNLTSVIQRSGPGSFESSYHVSAMWKVDLAYHWLTNFVEISSFETLRERITNPKTCGAPATVIAVNKYLSVYPTQRTNLFKGSPYIWKIVAEGFTPIALYKTEVALTGQLRTSFFQQNRSNFQSNYWSEPKNLTALFLQAATEIPAVPEQTELLGYNTRATEFFPFKSEKTDKHKTFLGVELELEGFTQSEFQNLKVLNKHAIFKRDGSLRSGVEICTAPASLDSHVAAFKPFFDSLEENGSDLEALNSCGMHVHIDKSKLTKLHIANLHMFLNNSENEEHIVSIAGRPANSYCGRADGSYGMFTGTPVNNRYQRLNHTPSATVELRMFASTTSFEEFCTRLEFTQAAVDYTKPGFLNLNVKQIQQWDNFISYVQSNKKSYSSLAKELTDE